jgi:imidazolonepropionase-like amidohydrolase
MGVALIGIAWVARFPVVAVPARGAVLRNVTVVNPGHGRRVNQTVTIRGSTIDSIVDAEGSGGGAQRLFALPGLIDMHVHHPFASGVAGVSGDIRLFDLLFLAHGVTTVRDTGSMDGSLFVERRRIQSGELPGPRIFACGYIIDGDPPGWPKAVVVKTADEARNAVDQQVALGADCIKVYDHVSSEALAAVRDEAAVHHLKVIGHLPRGVKFEDAHLADVQHLTGVAPPNSNGVDPIGGMVEAWHNLSPARIDFVVRTSRQQGIAHTPTMVVPTQLFRLIQDSQPIGSVDDRLLSLFPESLELPRYYREALWKPGFLLPSEFPASIVANAPLAFENLKRVVRRLHEAGVELHVGTDTPNPFVVPGASLWRELQNFVDAGFSTEQAWEAATAGAGRFLGTRGLGVLEEGAPADILLFREDPTVDLRAASTLEAVVADGRYYSKDTLDKAAGSYRRRFGNPLYDRVAMGAFTLIAAGFRPRRHLFEADKH